MEWWRRVTSIAVLPSDSADERIQKRLQVAMAMLSIPAVGSWSVSFLLLGHPVAALFPFAYCALTLVMLGVLAWTRRFAWFSAPHIALVLVSPYLLQWHLGGFSASGGAMLWCLLAPVAAMLFLGTGRAVPWFAALAVMAMVGALRDGPLAPAQPVLSRGEAACYFAFNTVGFAFFLFFGTRYFVQRIGAEKERSERLLLNVLPRPIAERLKREEAVIADRFEQVTVLFSDIVGFTGLSQRLSPARLVELLDEVFSAFDALADQYGLEKIKTIGDAYMVVGGLPVPDAGSARRVAEMALAMRDYVERFSRERGFELAMRIGIHSGEVVAGVIGRRKFSYDLWGDTVNTASRMESHGQPGRIQVSAETYALLGEGFGFESRGSIPVKGKGELQTYWLERTEPLTQATHG